MISQILEHTGGILILLKETVLSIIPPRVDSREFFRILYYFGVKSITVVLITALLTGFIMVMQVSNYINMLGATGIIGWASGLAIFSEVGPILIGIMFSGQAGAFNAAEIGTMKITEQLEAMRALGIDFRQFIVFPRILAMTLVLGILTIIGDATAIIGSMIFSNILFNIEPIYFINSLIEKNLLIDFITGIIKSMGFGLTIGIVSCYFGLLVHREPREVGIAVNRSVVISALGILVIDYFFAIFFI